MKKVMFTMMVMAFGMAIGGCSPEVGSDAWCKQMQEKPKADWTASEASDYAKYCVFK